MRLSKAPSEGGTMSDLKFPVWQQLYLEALMELDEQKLARRVVFAETTILSRLEEIQYNSNQRVERQAIEDALNGLNSLKEETAELKKSQEHLLHSTQFRVN
jgi:hypothetical protein